MRIDAADGRSWTARTTVEVAIGEGRLMLTTSDILQRIQRGAYTYAPWRAAAVPAL